jgi:mono/diheme cytochrome c family protein
MTENEAIQDGTEQELVGLLAEFDSPKSLIAGARQVRAGGYRKLEAFSPFPVHGIDEAMGIKPTILPWLVLGAGLTGAVAALAGQWWTNAVNYPFLISGKPTWSLPANIPVIFEVIILFSAFTAFLGMLALNGLPKLFQPLFRSKRFRRVTSDRFFLMIQADDDKFSLDETSGALTSAGATHVEQCMADAQSGSFPKWVGMVLLTLAVVAMLPPLLIARARVTKSEKPRWHTFIDMDYQPKFKAQTTSTLFADGRADRLPVPGTVARGDLRINDPLYRGSQQGGVIPTETETEDGEEIVIPWVTEIPLPITDSMMQRGRQRFDIYCAPCHGLSGDGNGLVAIRARELQQSTWVPPASLHTDPVRQQPVGQLFHSITNGVRKMSAYGSQISVEDRWAIVLYIRALQRSQNASPEDVPQSELETMRDL